MSRTLSVDEARTAIAAVLSPYLGRVMAESSARLHLDRLGAGRAIGAAEAEELVNGIGRGLKVFVGEQRSTQVQAELRAALAQLQGAP